MLLATLVTPVAAAHAELVSATLAIFGFWLYRQRRA